MYDSAGTKNLLVLTGLLQTYLSNCRAYAKKKLLLLLQRFCHTSLGRERKANRMKTKTSQIQPAASSLVARAQDQKNATQENEKSKPKPKTRTQMSVSDLPPVCWILIFTELASTPIQLISCDVHVFFVCCLFVPSDGTRNRVDWRILVEERIAKVANLRANFLINLSTFVVFSPVADCFIIFSLICEHVPMLSLAATLTLLKWSFIVSTKTWFQLVLWNHCSTFK